MACLATTFCSLSACKNAPPVQANLVNCLWPLLIVVLAPVLLPGLAMRWQHILAGLIGFAGAAMVILAGVDGGADSGAPGGLQSEWLLGYLAAAVAAFIWSTYSLLTRRVPHFDTAAIGTFAWISGLLALLCHALMEPGVTLSLRDWALIGLMGLGPLGGSFFLWDKALKIGDARHIELLSYLTPLLSTSLLLWVSDRALTWPVAMAGVLIVGAAWLGTRVK
jgi:drug/metabolite transporter (DMT)-like permease